MFSNDNVFLEEFYISYNGKLTFKCIEILHKHSRDLKVLHIAKYIVGYSGRNSSRKGDRTSASTSRTSRNSSSEPLI
jgi:hypothetical protein